MKPIDEDKIPPILTTEDVMQRMGWKDRDAVYRQVREHRLKPIAGVRPHRFTREAFLDFLHGRYDQRPAAGPSGRGGRRRPSEPTPGKSSGAATLIDWMKDVEPVIRAR